MITKSWKFKGFRVRNAPMGAGRNQQAIGKPRFVGPHTAAEEPAQVGQWISINLAWPR